MRRQIYILLFAFCTSAQAGQSVDGLVGKWTLAADSRLRLAPECRNLTIEITADGHVIRRTGALVYKTKAHLVPEGEAVRLVESLEEHNGKHACNGAPAGMAVRHLRYDALAVPDNGLLRYYRDDRSEQYLEFARVESPS